MRAKILNACEITPLKNSYLYVFYVICSQYCAYFCSIFKKIFRRFCTYINNGSEFFLFCGIHCVWMFSKITKAWNNCSTIYKPVYKPVYVTCNIIYPRDVVIPLNIIFKAPVSMLSMPYHCPHPLLLNSACIERGERQKCNKKLFNISNLNECLFTLALKFYICAEPLRKSFIAFYTCILAD